MPALVHNLLAAYFKKDISQQIAKIMDGNGSTAELAKGIISEDSALIALQDGTTRHPDAQFRHVKARYPGVIIEISNSQTAKNLAYLADQYVVETSGSVNGCRWNKTRLPRNAQG